LEPQSGEIKMKKSILAASLLLAASNANAIGGFFNIANYYYYTTGSVGTVTSGALSKDIWQVTCPANVVKVEAVITDLPPAHPAVMTLQLSSGSAVSAITYDTEINTRFSNPVTVVPTSSLIYAHVTKQASTTKGADNYELGVMCYTRTSTGTTFMPATKVVLYKNNLPQ
jgi:hypothetical protein